MTTSHDGPTIRTSDIAAYTVAEMPPPHIVINGEDQRTPLVTIHPNGELEYGPDYTPDEAARRFWEALQHYMPGRCTNCSHVPGHPAP